MRRARIAAGTLGDRGRPAAAKPADLAFGGFACLEPDGDTPQAARRSLSAFVDHWYATWIRPGLEAARQSQALHAGENDGPLDPDDAAAVVAALERQQRSRLLTVTRAGFAGADRINADLARRGAADTGSAAPTADTILPGTPVMITRNDYDRGLYNGDQGVVLSVISAKGGRPGPAAVFLRGGRVVSFPLQALHGSLALAYASTVHKAQGSELEHAALILPTRICRCCHANWSTRRSRASGGRSPSSAAARCSSKPSRARSNGLRDSPSASLGANRPATAARPVGNSQPGP
jgi:hypothetical protein